MFPDGGFLDVGVEAAPAVLVDGHLGSAAGGGHVIGTAYAVDNPVSLSSAHIAVPTAGVDTGGTSLLAAGASAEGAVSGVIAAAEVGRGAVDETPVAERGGGAVEAVTEVGLAVSGDGVDCGGAVLAGWPTNRGRGGDAPGGGPAVGRRHGGAGAAIDGVDPGGPLNETAASGSSQGRGCGDASVAVRAAADAGSTAAGGDAVAGVTAGKRAAVAEGRPIKGDTVGQPASTGNGRGADAGGDSVGGRPAVGSDEAAAVTGGVKAIGVGGSAQDESGGGSLSGGRGATCGDAGGYAGGDASGDAGADAGGDAGLSAGGDADGDGSGGSGGGGGDDDPRQPEGASDDAGAENDKRSAAADIREYIQFFRDLGMGDAKKVAFLAGLLRDFRLAASRLDNHLFGFSAAVDWAVSRLRSPTNPSGSAEHLWIRVHDRLGFLRDDDSRAQRLINIGMAFAYHHLEMDSMAVANARLLKDMERMVKTTAPCIVSAGHAQGGAASQEGLDAVGDAPGTELVRSSAAK